MQPPSAFDEALRKFDRLGDVSFASGGEGGSGSEGSPPARARGAPDEGEHSSQAGTEAAALQYQAEAQAEADLGLRKAHFFANCLRADRALESPRPPPPKLRSGQPRLRTATASPDLKESGVLSTLNPDGTAPKTINESMGGFVSSCRQARIHPTTTGIIRAEGGLLKLEYGCLTDMRAEAMLYALRASATEVREASLRSNGLTEKGAKHLLEALPESVESVDLSQNDLGHGIHWCLSVRRLTCLRSFNVSDCQLGDQVCQPLCEALRSCLALRSVNLSGNNIYLAGLAIGNLVRGHKVLEDLDVHWNQMTGESAHDLVRGLAENGQAGRALRSIDLAWNPLGKLGGEETCQQMAQLFRETRALRHVDLSKCELTAQHCQVLAEGLQQNRTILGLHIGGNAGYMAPNGTLVPVYSAHSGSAPKEAAPAAAGPPGAAADEAQQRLQAEQRVQRSTSVVQEHGSNCWICERWREVRLSYTPGVSGPAASAEGGVWAFTSLDGFERPTRLARQGADFAAHFMAPAGTLRYVFQVGTELLPSRTSPLAAAEEAGPAGPLLRIRRVRLPGEAPEELPGGGGGQEGQLGVGQSGVEVRVVNRMEVAARRPEEPVCHALVPRQDGVASSSSSAAPPEAWDVEQSLFAPYEEALVRRPFCEKCFELDWRLSCAGQLVKEEGDRQAVKELLRSHYAEIKVLYSSLCSADWTLARQSPESRDRPLVFGVGLHEYTHMLVQHNLVGEEVTLEEADAQFVAAAAPSKDILLWARAADTQGRLLLRQDFFELLVRLAVRWFARAAGGSAATGGPASESPAPRSRVGERRDPRGGASKASSVSKALEYLLNKHIMYPYPPMKNNFKAVQWRVDVLHTEVVETVMRQRMQDVLEPLFSLYAVPGSFHLRHIRPEGWFALLDAMEVFQYQGAGGQMALWDRAWLWQISAMAHVDELIGTKHLELSFVEYLEAMARLVALLRSRERVAAAAAEEAEKWDYGLGAPSAASIFCVDKEGVMDKDEFAGHLDAFLASPRARRALTARPPSTARAP